MSREPITIPDKEEFKINEVCQLAGVKPFVLRYWEQEFPELAPAKQPGGQRVYRREDVLLVMRIKQLLYEEQFTVAGAKKRLAEEREAASAVPDKLDKHTSEQVQKLRQALSAVKQELAEMLQELSA
ncbi:MAG: MerR family transcriptional regulator [Thermoanaerobaculum sp.]|nr:MerR family transcriptional regulator [Thermoanaerobaculum sp.]